MLQLTSEIGQTHGLKFNSTALMVIKFGNKIDEEKLSFYRDSIEWFNRVRHLGNIVNNELTDVMTVMQNILHL